jgi:hypothetical protein
MAQRRGYVGNPNGGGGYYPAPASASAGRSSMATSTTATRRRRKVGEFDLGKRGAPAAGSRGYTSGGTIRTSATTGSTTTKGTRTTVRPNTTVSERIGRGSMTAPAVARRVPPVPKPMTQPPKPKQKKARTTGSAIRRRAS